MSSYIPFFATTRRRAIGLLTVLAWSVMYGAIGPNVVLASPPPQPPADASGTITCQPTVQRPTCLVYSGILTATQTWLSNTMYVIDYPGLTIPPGMTLTVGAGTIVKLYVPGAWLDAFGTLD